MYRTSDTSCTTTVQPTQYIFARPDSTQRNARSPIMQSKFDLDVTTSFISYPRTRLPFIESIKPPHRGPPCLAPPISRPLPQAWPPLDPCPYCDHFDEWQTRWEEEQKAQAQAG